MSAEIPGAGGRLVFGEIAARGVETEAVVGETYRLGAVHMRLADDDFDVEAGAVLAARPDAVRGLPGVSPALHSHTPDQNVVCS